MGKESDKKDAVAAYRQARDEGTKRVVARQSRGNVCVQDGWYMDRAELDQRSKSADSKMKSLKRDIKLPRSK